MVWSLVGRTYYEGAQHNYMIDINNNVYINDLYCIYFFENNYYIEMVSQLRKKRVTIKNDESS